MREVKGLRHSRKLRCYVREDKEQVFYANFEGRGGVRMSLPSRPDFGHGVKIDLVTYCSSASRRDLECENVDVIERIACDSALEVENGRHGFGFDGKLCDSSNEGSSIDLKRWLRRERMCASRRR